jgi:putative transcription factor
LFTTIIEETEMKACNECAKYGKVIKEIKPIQTLKKEAKAQIKNATLPVITLSTKNELYEKIVEDYSNIIKKKRDQMSMTQKEFAMFLAEKESLLHKIETGAIEPNIKTARKFEKILNIQLVEEYEEKKQDDMQRSKSNDITIGDLITIKRR